MTETGGRSFSSGKLSTLGAPATQGRIVGGEAMKFDWQRLNAEYSKQFGIEVMNPYPAR